MLDQVFISSVFSLLLATTTYHTTTEFDLNLGLLEQQLVR